MTNPLKSFRSAARCSRGSVAVEFAMLMPVMVMAIFGIVVFGSYLAVIHGVQQLAAEAARSSVAGLSNAERASIASNYVASNATTYPLIDPSHLSVNASGNASNTFVVTVNYDASSMFIYALPAVLAPPTTITRSAAIPYGGF